MSAAESKRYSINILIAGSAGASVQETSLMWRQLRGIQGSGSPPQQSRGQNRWIKLLFWLERHLPCRGVVALEVTQSAAFSVSFYQNMILSVIFMVYGEKKNLCKF